MATRKGKSNKTLWILLVVIIIATTVILLLPDSLLEKDTDKGSETTEQVEVEAATLAKKGSEAPDFTVAMFDGGQITLSQLRGKVVLVNFWATWCPPCRKELQRVQKDLIDRFAGQEFVFLPISRGEPYDEVAAFRDKTGYTFPMGLDPKQEIYGKYANNYIPRNFLISPEGRIIAVSTGYEPEEFDRLVETISTALSPNNK